MTIMTKRVVAWAWFAVTVLAVVFYFGAPTSYAQCGALVLNPTTGKLDCSGPTTAGATGATGAAGATGASGAAGATGATGAAGAAGGGQGGWSGLPLTFASTTTQYTPYAGGGLASATEAEVSTKAAGAATISNLHVTLDVALGADVVLSVTLENGAATASALTCSTAAGGTSCDDITHSVSVANQALLAWKLIKVSGTVTAGLPQIKVVYSTGTSGVGTTSVGFTGGLISVATPTTTPAFTVAGTSGGVPYFSAASTWASSGALAAKGFVFGGGAGASPDSTAQCAANTLPHGNGASSPTCSAIVNADITNATIDLTAKVTGALPAANVSTALRNGGFGVTFDGGGSALTAGTTIAKYIVLPYACTIIAFDITVDAGTATFKTWRKATGTAIPTVSDSISTAGVAISSGTALHSTTVSDWTDVTLDINDIIGLNLSAVATATLVTFSVTCQK